MPTLGPLKPECKHQTKDKAYKCSELTDGDVRKFHDNFYAQTTKIAQDGFILKCISSVPVKRHRSVTGVRENPTTIIKYFVQVNAKTVPVCRQAFLRILNLKKHRVQGVAKRFLSTGVLPKETRGGDRRTKLYDDKRRSVINFIKTFQCIESHYCRSKSSVRVYVSSDLNIMKMHRMYNQSCDDSLKVKCAYFRHIFNTRFNIGFGTPRTDVCSKCLELTEKLKTEKDQTVKNALICEQKIHKLKYRAFYNLLKEKRDDLVTVSFDCQKNFPLPRVPDQIVYYKRQLYLYNFTIVKGSSKDPLKNNSFSYVWGEHEYSKGSEEIASCVYNFLSTKLDLSSASTLRCVADGCGGQNKNSVFLGMLAYWFRTKAPATLKRIEVVFPIVGHSFLPPDRVFAQIEKKITRTEIMVDPDEYFDIIKQHASVTYLGTPECALYNWKAAFRDVIKPPAQWHFKFLPTKRFIFCKSGKNEVLVQGEEAYKSEFGVPKSLVRRGKKIGNISLMELPRGKKIKEEKLQDIDTILKKHYGSEWQDLDFLDYYKNILTNNELFQELSEDPMCEHPEEVEQPNI